ncbi:MAG: XdhC/CoxI family protein [Phycisphaerae bacterium]
MSELLPVLDTLLADARAGKPSALCTVVKTKGSTPQGPGAAMLVRGDFSTCGTIGGGCVEAEIRRRAFELMESNRSVLLDYVLDHDDSWDDGLICGGRIYVAVNTVTAETDLTPFQTAADHARQRRPAQFPLVVENNGKRQEYRLNLEVPPTLLIAGAGHVGQAVARLALELDFHVVAIDERPEYASRARFGDKVDLVVDDIAAALARYPIDAACAVVIVTRGHNHDHQALEAVIRGDAGYVGLIGSKRKARMIFDDLRDSGVPPDRLERVHTPIGLDIGAMTVSEIAVSIVAQLVQHRRKNAPPLVEGPFELAGPRSQ